MNYLIYEVAYKCNENDISKEQIDKLLNDLRCSYESLNEPLRDYVTSNCKLIHMFIFMKQEYLKLVDKLDEEYAKVQKQSDAFYILFFRLFFCCLSNIE